MAGNTKETAIWEGADVYVDFDGTSTDPSDLTTAWGTGWELAGLLDGEAGFVQGREEETGEHYAWGGILHKRTRSKHKRTLKFAALEDNDTIFKLVNPGSERTTALDVRTSTIKVPKGVTFKLGMEVRAGDRVKRRVAQTCEMQEIGEIKEAENEPTIYEITVVVFPESDGTLFTELETDPTTL